MEPSNNKQLNTTKLFIVAGLVLLGLGMIYGLTGAIQYLVPGFLKKYFSFEKVRPLHVSAVVFWIILGAMGSVLIYLQQHTGKKLHAPMLTKIQLLVFLFTILAILTSYYFGVFGGREYWEFHPLLALPILSGWILFLFNVVKSIGTLKNQPVYVWMWLTGVVFFLFTFLESYLWIFPYFRNNIVNDMTIQWKSYGSMVGAWNMLIYGSSFFLMEKISGEKTYSTSRMGFLLYFIGLFNLMFNWGHHIYTLPTHHFIQYISYVVSMTELLILGRIIYEWRASVSAARRHFHHAAYKFLIAADVWVFLSLLLAICMSVPAINIYTHGTYITVAHTMGATIGINTFLLLAIAFDILHETCRSFEHNNKLFNRTFFVINGSLFAFWISLILVGVMQSKWQMSEPRILFGAMMLQLRPFLISFFVFGLILTIGIVIIIYPLIKNQLLCYFTPTTNQDHTPTVAKESMSDNDLN